MTEKQKYIGAFLDGYFSDKKIQYGFFYFEELEKANKKAKKKYKIMKAKQKARELVNRYQNEVGMFSAESKKCALISVDEILSMKIVRKNDLTEEYWEEVKAEIENL